MPYVPNWFDPRNRAAAAEYGDVMPEEPAVAPAAAPIQPRLSVALGGQAPSPMPEGTDYASYPDGHPMRMEHDRQRGEAMELLKRMADLYKSLRGQRKAK
jgi:hypothetical protein